ncbi:MAG TPA: signal peptide peptidase SppA [Polyangia bacterium]|nr:signal peptide peptidase SppA [Polyangia bacterium]
MRSSPGVGGRRVVTPRAALAASAAFLALALLAARPVRAQASDPELRPTRGPTITDGARAGDADATAVQLNPGALGFLPAAGLELVGADASDPAVVPRRGFGAYLGLPIFLRSSLGLGLSRVAGASAVGIDAHTTFQLAYALHFLRNASLGFSWAHIWDGSFAGADTFDFGFSARAGRYVALGATVEDVGEPHPNAFGATLPRLWTAELVLRPLGTARLEVALGAAHANGDDWDRLVPRARISATLIDGLRLYGEGENVPRGAATFGGGSDTRLAFGMAIDFDHLGLVVGVPIFIPGNGSSGAGIAGRIHLDGERRPALVAPPYVARVRLEGIEDDRHFFQVVRRLRALAVDPAVAGVLFKIEGVTLGYGRIEELRDLVALLRAHGKRTFGYLTFPSTREYYLAAACDVIVIHPAGELSVTGVATNVTFYKGTMDRLGVHLELVRVGAFKGAMEPFIMTEQSPAVRENKNQLLDDVYNRLTATIAADRTRAGHPMDAAIVRGLIDRGIFSAGDATLAGLGDAVAAEGDLEAFVQHALGRANLRLRDPDSSPAAPAAWPSRRVAVLFVDGTMVDGPNVELPFGMGDFAGSDTLSAALEQCRRDPTIAAVVLRVNSPGGSAFASDVLAREIKKVRQAGKPIVVSMGDLAASGGYYIAAPADVIYAEPSTTTGSIGVFGYKVDAQKLLAMLGMNVETYRRGAHADFLSPYRPWTDEERALALQQIQHLYQLFVATVADGRRSRGLTAARVDELGRGHVWTGALAQGLGLVDRLGGVSAAIDEAARLGGVPVGRDHLPDLALLPVENKGLLRRLAGAASALEDGAIDGATVGSVLGSDEQSAEQSNEQEAPVVRQPASLLTGDARAALRLLAPFLVQGSGAGFAARLPYDIDLW